MSVIDGLARYAAAHVAGLTFDATGATGNVFVEALPANPDTAVAFKSTGGPESDSLQPWNSPTLQVIVRGDMDPRTALTLWYAVFGALHGLRNTVLPDGTYLEACIAVNSGPADMGTDTAGRYRYSLNLRTEVIHASSFRPPVDGDVT